QSRNDAVGGYEVQNIEALNDGGGVRGDDLIVLPTAGDVARGGSEAHETIDAEVFHARVGVASDRRQRHRRLRRNRVKNRPMKSAAEGVRLSMKVERDALLRFVRTRRFRGLSGLLGALRGHGRHLVYLIRKLIILTLGVKSNLSGRLSFGRTESFISSLPRVTAIFGA